MSDQTADAQSGAAPPDIATSDPSGESAHSPQRFRWTPQKFCQSITLFVLSAAAEVGGGWLTWQSIRSGKPWWWALFGSLTLIVYGFIPTLQPVDHFGRTFAAYGGFFIVYSYAWGWLLDNEQPDTGVPPVQHMPAAEAGVAMPVHECLSAYAVPTHWAQETLLALALLWQVSASAGFGLAK